MTTAVCSIDFLRYRVSDDLFISADHLPLMPREVVHLDAPSGSGKSLLALAMVGYAVEGSSLEAKVTIDGVTHDTADHDLRRHVGLVFQQPRAYFNPVLTIGQHLSESAAGPVVEARDDWARAFAALDMDVEALWSSLPAACAIGELQRIYWLMVKRRRPRWIIADEPLAHIDHRSRALVVEDMIAYIHAHDAALLLITHDEVPTTMTVHRYWRIEGGVVRVGEPPRGDAPQLATGDEAVAAQLLLRLEGVQYTYPRGAQPVLSAIHLGLSAGDRMGIMGRSGSGKSTLLAILSGRIQPDVGESYGCGAQYYHLSTLLRRPSSSVRLVAQDPYASFEAHMPIQAQLHDVHTDGIAKDMKALGLRMDLLDRRPAALSGGELQRLAIIAAVQHPRPEVLLLDESLSALDRAMRYRVVCWLDERLPETAILCVAHRYSHLKAWCHEVRFMVDGQLSEGFRPGQEGGLSEELKALLSG